MRASPRLPTPSPAVVVRHVPATLRPPRLWLGPLGVSLRIVLLLFFLWLTARHWHPYYGFTRFLQADTSVTVTMLSSLREAPLYIHRDPGSYDGFFYAQIATDPLVNTPELRTAVDDLGYRARRILLGALAWVIGHGDPSAIIHAYSWINVVAWFALAGLLWRLFPTSGWRGTVAWSGILFAAGTLLSVRFALTDLAALLLIVGATMRVESGRPGWAGGLLSLGALARETALLGAVALLRTRGATPRQRINGLLLCFVAALPLALWLIYLWETVGSSGAGLRNFAWPLQGWLKKSSDLFIAWNAGADRPLVLSTVLGHIALTVQLAFVALHSSRNNHWWRIGAAFGGLMLCIGPAVWGDDLPGASVRVLLPLSVAFNVLAVRLQSSAAWLVLGNLSVVGGVLALWPVTSDTREVATGRLSAAAFVVQTDDNWHSAEVGKKGTWAWSAHGGEITVRTWPRIDRPILIEIALRGFTPREVEITLGGEIVARREIGGDVTWIALPVQPALEARLTLHIHSHEPPGRESEAAGGRALGFAICGVRVKEVTE